MLCLHLTNKSYGVCLSQACHVIQPSSPPWSYILKKPVTTHFIFENILNQ